MDLPAILPDVLDLDNPTVQHRGSRISESMAAAKDQGNDNNDNDSVQVMTSQQAERDLRRKRRRELRRVLNHPNKRPSFLAILNMSSSKSNVDEKENGIIDLSSGDADNASVYPPIVVIDVDEYLGLKKKQKTEMSTSQFPPITVSSSVVSNSSIPTSVPSAVTSSMSSTVSTGQSNAASTPVTPAEEGWYEGSRIMAMPEDHIFLSEPQVWIRQHLEYFSATELDVQQSQAGRRTKTVRGKVGIRCIHCARNILPKLNGEGQQQHQDLKKVSWPPGTVTYPLNFSGLYSGASQKPQLHFENCPYLPPTSKLAIMLQEARANQTHTASSSASTTASNPPLSLTGIGKRKRMVQGVSGLMYYVISCERIGLREIPNQGLRFARDLTLEPLDFESTRMRVEHDHPDLIPRQYQQQRPSTPSPVPPTKAPRLPASAPDRVTSESSDNYSATIGVDGTSSTVGDANSQQVLKKCWDEIGSSNEQNQASEGGEEQSQSGGLLIRRSDKALLSDYMFLAIAQMAICHANEEDFSTRGKKTKLMRIGFAGFCCRHCQHHSIQYSCRSFSSAADNLASAISNSFVLHLQKCPYTPQETKLALATLKRSHAKQISSLPYGSQRKLFFEIWERMRAADKPSLEVPSVEDDNDDDDEGDQAGLAQETDETGPADVDDDEDLEGTSMHSTGDQDSTQSSHNAPRKSAASTLGVDPTRPNSRTVNFPVSTDPETQKCLKQAEDSWDPTENDHLILPEDRYLVSDYVFLTMRQLKVALPTPADFRGNRRNNVLGRMPGMCCIHCAHEPTSQTPSGRTFPSAPDNMASALNSSLYNHMQHCSHLPLPIKLACQNLRKIHSQQCASMTFGSQRRFFNKVYAKLKRITLSDEQVASFASGSKESTVAVRRSETDPILDKAEFEKYSFVEGGTVGVPYWQCLKCRMIPFEFRAIGAVHYVRPSVHHLKQHISICKKDGLSLGWLRIAISELREDYKHDKVDEVLERLITLAVGGDTTLASTFLNCQSEASNEKSTQEIHRDAWWCKVEVDFDCIQTEFERGATELGLSSRRILDHPKFRRVLEIVAPALQFPIVVDDSENGGDSTLTNQEISPNPTKPEKLAENEVNQAKGELRSGQERVE